MSGMEFKPAVIGATVLFLILAKWGAELLLQQLNRRHVLAHARAVPEAFRDSIDEATYAKSVQYTLAKSRLSQFEDAYSICVLIALLFSGILPRAYYSF